MATHGSMSEFKPGGKESWTTYTERLDHYFAANGVTDADKKRSILLAVCGAATFKTLKSQVDAATFRTMDYAGLCRLARDTLSQSPHPLCSVSNSILVFESLERA